MKYVPLILAVLFLLTGCAPQTAPQTPPEVTESAAPAPEPSSAPVFTDGGTHKPTESYKQVFTFLTTANDNFTLNIESAVFEEARAVRLWETIIDDLKTIADAGPVAQKLLTIYVVQKPLHGGAEWIGDRIYCSAEDVESGAYREALTCASYDFMPKQHVERADSDKQVLASASYDFVLAEHWWKPKSLAACIFGEAADEEALRAYYTQSEDMDILSLFPAYFINAFASEEELYLANETALSLSAYIIGKYGRDAFFQGSSDYRQEWLTALGVNREYLDPYAETFAGYTYSSSPDYPLIVTTDKQDEFYLSPLRGDMEAAKSVREFFYFTKKGMAAILAGIEKDAPDYYQTIADNYYAAPIRDYLGNRSITISHGSWEARRIDQSVRDSILHEMVHVIVPQYSEGYEDVWRHEGLANYLPYTYATAEQSQLGGRLGQGAYEILYGDNSGLEEYVDCLEDYRETYFKHAGKPNTPQDINFAWVDTSWFYTLLKYPQYQDALLTPIAHNEFSYEGAYLFTKYLAEKYSLSTVLQYCLSGYNTTFEDVYGISYEKAKAAWMKEFVKQMGE